MDERDRGAAPARRRGPTAGLVLATGLLLAALAAAQEIPVLGESETAAAAADPGAPAEIERRRVALAEEIAAAEQALRAAPDEASRAHAERVLEQLRGLGALLDKQAELVGPGAAATSPEPLVATDEPPSLQALNQLYEEKFALEARRARRVEVRAAREDALASAKEKLDVAERERRAARSAFEEAETSSAKATAARELERRRLESRAAQERVTLRTLEVRAARPEAEDGALQAELEARIEGMRAALARGEGAPLAGLPTLAEQEGALRLEHRADERRLASVELRLEAANQRFSRQSDPPPELLDEIAALRSQRELIRQEIALIDARAERLAAQGETWQHWGAALTGAGSHQDFEGWKRATEERLAALQQSALERESRRADLEARQRDLEARLGRTPEGARLHSILAEQRAALTRLLDAERQEAAHVDEDLRVSARALDALRVRTGEFEPLRALADLLQSVRDIWRYEVTTVDDAPITVGSLALALLLAAAGLWASRRGSALVGRLATQRFRLDTGAADALETLSFYLLLVSFTLLALRAVHFPLTAFTVLGGALAIGLGFGSQNVMNNFISGLILMLERPIRVGDVIEVNDDHGTVEKIGARSTQIRSMDGRHIVVPNSSFLENNVVNWTLSDDLIRTSVTVGVIYGSPTRQVRDLILRVVKESKDILKHPPPNILFEDFGNNSLDFEVLFWVRARSPIGMRKIQSDVRFQIDDLFREHGLVIAFPQRDVHLDSSSPIEVRMLDRGDPDPESHE